MDVFGFAVAGGGDFLRDAAIDAAYELGTFAAVAATPCTLDELADRAGIGRGRHRLRALLDVLVALGAIGRADDRYTAGSPPPRPVVARAGWGLAADVIRRDRALAVEGGAIEQRYHRHLAITGAPRARELATLLGSMSLPAGLVDLGGGAGAYTAAFLDAHPAAHATLVDYHEVVALARGELARFGDRVRYVSGDARVAQVDGHGVVLLANVLHLHGAASCAGLCEAAARMVVPGGIVVIEELRVDDDRSGPLASLLFALNMALYTGEGDVYSTAQLHAWLIAAGLVDVVEHRLACAPGSVVVVGRRPQ